MATQNTLSITENISENSFRQPPHNMEAEQALLGAILVNNEAMHHIGDYLRAEHFYVPVHQRIFTAIQSLFDKGLIANPITLKSHFDQDEGLQEIGGGGYLVRLAAAASSVINVKSYSEVIYDAAQKRSLITIGEDVVNTAYKSDLDVSAGEQIEHAEQKLFVLASEGISENSFRQIKHGMIEAIQRVEYAFRNSDRVIGVPTKLIDLDKMLGGLHKSDLLILAGRPSMGKTALATTIAHNAAEYFYEESLKNPGTKPQSVGFFSLEMSAEQLASRVLAGATRLNSGKMRKGDLTPDEFAVLVKESNKLSQLPIFIDDTPALSISAVRARARRLKRVNNLGFLVVDYLQLIRGSSTASQANRVQEVSEITQGLKAIAKELNIPVMALSQLSRAVEQRDDKRPQLSDLRESGSIEQDADIVIFVFREEYYLMRKMPREGTPEHATWMEEMEKVHGIAEAIVAKHRNGGVGNVAMHFHSETTRFENLERDYALPEFE
ncbi:MAG TPA: replicative DNA helicase [Rickettsiales bacterium]|nr:replicative DNA helicase [Rickettsiales bacterium]